MKDKLEPKSILESSCLCVTKSVAMPRTIVHADLDAFYASVEQLENPELRGKPVVVGGSPEGRGVVMAASYEARRFGIRSAMPMSRALRLCPRAVRVPARFDRYSQVSREVMAIFRDVTALVEPMSLDEAFLDTTEQIDGFEGPESLGRHLKEEVRKRTGLVLSVGIAANKLVAKIASDTGKPDGLVVVPPGAEAAFLSPLKVRALWGVGPKAEALLNAAGFHTIGQLAAAQPAHLEASLGSRGVWLYDIARGIDNSPVTTEHERKSVGAENTFPRDLSDGPELRGELDRIAKNVARRLARSEFRARTVVLKLRYASFRTITRQSSRPVPIANEREIAAAAHALLDAVANPGDRFRLIGIHATNLVKGELDQLGLRLEMTTGDVTETDG
jgi:DNA polymerase-4